MRPELEEQWLAISQNGDSKERDRLKMKLLRSCKTPHEVFSLPSEMKEFGALLYWATNRRQGERSRIEQQCVDTAVEYILSARHDLVDDDDPVNTVVREYNELASTVRQWVSRRKDYISINYPILDNAHHDEKDAVRKMINKTQRQSLERHAEIWRNRV